MKLRYFALISWLALFSGNTIIASTIASTIAATNDVAEKYAGDWVVNVEETDLLREELDEKPTVLAGPGKVSISVLGLPIPTGRSKVGPQSPLSAADPALLRSRTMSISVAANKISIQYPEVGGKDAKEVLRKGHYRGRDSKWSHKKIEQKYKTTERKVTKTWSIRGDGRLLAVVTIKNPGSKKRTFSRVFDRTQ
ncbi:hypothetical protein N9M30_06350 [Pseudomonadales bacterium]|jgi:hypothetical protein|nr:hypothetical protein [Pseudomonadales bacterium]MDB0050814.1 hypothetical protein [Pseudomonadales bacterium]